jgi:DivIVA domain-containing protein
MSATELDLPVLISAEQIRRREFVTIRRGYDPHQVRDYLDQLAGQVDMMASMIREARLEADAALRDNAQPKVDPYERLAQRVASVIREADETAERLQMEGRRDSERMIEEARSDADRIRTDAQAKAEEARDSAERSLREAREKADRTLSGLSTRRETLVEQLSQMQERLLGVARDLEATIEAPDAVEIVDVTSGDEPSGPVFGEPSGPVNVFGEPDHTSYSDLDSGLDSGLDDPSYEELWEGAQSLQLEMPEIPPLDLSWDDRDEEDDPPKTD